MIETVDERASFRDFIDSVKKALSFFKRYRLFILLNCLAGSGLGLTYSFLKKPLYSAELTFIVDADKSSGGLGGAFGLVSQIGLDIDGRSSDAFSGENLIALFKSRSMIEKALLSKVTVNGKRQTLAESYIEFNRIRESWKEDPNLKRLQFSPGENRREFAKAKDSVLGSLYDRISSKLLVIGKADKKSGIVSVKTTSKDEFFSKHFTENLVNTVSNFYVETKTKKGAQNLQILQHQTDSVRRQLNGAISRSATSLDINPNPNPSLQILKIPSRHSEVDVEANKAILTELVKNLELAKISLRKETPLIQVVDAPILPLEKAEVSAMQGILIGGAIMLFLTIGTLFLIYFYNLLLKS